MTPDCGLFQNREIHVIRAFFLDLSGFLIFNF